MRRAIALLGLLAIAGAGLSLSLLPTRTVAAPSEHRTFLIPASDGYGVADCISARAECGKIVANAWCESQGYARAVTFGTASREDYTGALPRHAAEQPPAQPLAITCGN